MRLHSSDDNGPSSKRPARRNALWLAMAVAVASPARADEGSARLAAEVRGGAEGQTVAPARSADVATAAEPMLAPATRPAMEAAPAPAPAAAATAAVPVSPASPPQAASSPPRPASAESTAREPRAAGVDSRTARPSVSVRVQPAQDGAAPTVYQQFLVDLYASLPPTPPPPPPGYHAPAPPLAGYDVPIYLYDNNQVGFGSYYSRYDPRLGRVVWSARPFPTVTNPSTGSPRTSSIGPRRQLIPRPYQSGTPRSRAAAGTRY